MNQLAITFDDIQAAAARLRGIANRTPVHTSRTLDAMTGCQVFLKCENFQRGGAFKFRGAYNAISQLNAHERQRGVAAYSSGNHAQGVALAARLLDVPALICMPDDAPSVKLEATRGYGAEVLIYERRTVNREEFGAAAAAERGMTLIPPYNHPHIMAGQGTTALELLEHVPDLDTLLVPVGGGGLISGCALAAHSLRPSIRIFGVETEGADDTKLSLDRGTRICVPPPTTIADGMRTEMPGELTFPVVQRYVEDILIVSDDDVIAALRFLLLRMKLIVEPTGAVALAALLRGRLPTECQRVGVVLSGGNIAPSLLEQLWS
ncbi:MAG: threo-3-hydroxy-L-aspartate ammonia-lyase [Chloroflexales bacterium]|nr:threo-3-hydroxy-L-aspartate ammonia-lyase [Chloroflexales bacterium]